ncbi:MAG: FlgD immunoglobulin-like domain containing protein [Candidatus Krumholzibacteriia bacterium]
MRRHLRSDLLQALLLLTSLASAAAAPASPLGVPGCNGPVNALLSHDGLLYAGGAYTLAGGQGAGGIAGWNGTTWAPLGSGVAGVRTYWDIYGDTVDIPAQVYCLAVYDGELIAGGSFSSVGGTAAASIARWDGQQWRPLGAGMPNQIIYTLIGRITHSFPPAVHCLAVWQGELYAGGTFSSAGDSTTMAIARWDGSTWRRVGQGMAGELPPRVLALAADGDRLLAGGDFRVAGITPSERIGAWNGMVWAPVAVGGPDRAVHALLVRRGELLAGGEFTSADGVAAPFLARWNGSTWSGFPGGPPNPVRVLRELDGWIQAGAWAHAAGRWTNRLLTDGAVLTLAPWGDGLAFGGSFHTVGPRVGWNVEQWPLQPTAAPAGLPAAPQLTRVAPNPLNPGTTLDFTMPLAGPVTLAVFDARGRRVALLLERTLPAGEHAVTWDGRGAAGEALASGVYLAVLRTAEGTSARKLVVAR